MARETDIMNFCGLDRTLITICNIASMGKKFRVQKTDLKINLWNLASF